MDNSSPGIEAVYAGQAQTIEPGSALEIYPVVRWAVFDIIMICCSGNFALENDCTCFFRAWCSTLHLPVRRSLGEGGSVGKRFPEMGHETFL